MSGVRYAGGIDLGGTKIQAIVVDSENDVLGAVAPSDAARRRPAGRRRRDGRSAARGGRRGGHRDRSR